ncbi:MAG: YkgJ family cysteine cluster protein [Archangium sp.]
MKTTETEASAASEPELHPTRRGLASLMVGAAGLGMSLGLTPGTNTTVVIDKKDADDITLPSLVTENLARGHSVELLTRVNGSVFRATFKIEIRRVKLQLALTPDSAFSYACHGCGRCCYGKSISVNPYELLLLARALGRDTTSTLQEFVDPATRTLRRREDSACVFLDAGRCTVHAARPAACRVYPLAWVEVAEGEPRLARLDGHPQSAGVWGEAATVREYLKSQGLERFDGPYRRYRRIFARLVEVIARLERSPRDIAVPDVDWFDPDAVEGARARDAEAAFALHAAALETQLDRLEAQLDE